MTINLSEGETVLRIDFDKPEDSIVYQIKRNTAEIINLIGKSDINPRNFLKDQERLRLTIRAIEAYEIASMLAVKAATA